MCLEKDGRNVANLPIDHNIYDPQVIIHEFFHLTNNYKNNKEVRSLISEVISIYMKLKFCKFLDKKEHKNYYNKSLFNRICNTSKSVHALCFSGNYLDIYKKTGNISKESIYFLDKFGDFYTDVSDYLIQNYKNYKEEDFRDLIYDYNINLSYLLGTVIAIYLLKDEKINDIKIKYINENLYRLSLNEIFSILNIDINDMNEELDYCIEEFNKIGDDIFEESNSNSRSNCYR